MRRIHLAFSNRVCYTIETDDLTAMGRTHLISVILFPLIYRGVAQCGRALGSGPRGRVFKSHHSDQYKCPETVYSCGFRAFSFICVFRRFSPLTHTVTHTGFGRVVFGRLVCPLFYAAAILFRSALYKRLGFLAPTLLQKCPTLAFCRLGRGYFLPCLFIPFLRPQGFFLSEKK